MAELLSIARPYANAIFEIAKENKTIPAWQNALQDLAIITANDDIQNLFSNPEVTAQQIQNLYLELVNQSSKSILPIKPLVENLIALLAANKRFAILPAIQIVFNELVAEYEKIIKVDAISAFALEEKQQENLLAALSKRFNAKVEVEYHIDKTLIGGMIVRSGHWVLDGSVKGRLERLHEDLTKI